MRDDQGRKKGVDVEVEDVSVACSFCWLFFSGDAGAKGAAREDELDGSGVETEVRYLDVGVGSMKTGGIVISARRAPVTFCGMSERRFMV